MRKSSLDYCVIRKTKLDSTFTLPQFHICNYEVRARRDHDKNGDGLIEFAKRVF